MRRDRGESMTGHKRLISCLLLLLSGGVAAVCFAQQANFYAVIVGVSKFSNIPKEEWLEYADADAQDFQKVITSPRGRGFLPENVMLLVNDKAGIQAMKKRLATTLPRDLKTDDVVYLFVATHGVVEKEAAKEGYLMAFDSDREDLYNTALSMSGLTDIMLNRLRKAKRLFLFADACRSGKMAQGGSINSQMRDMSKERGETMVLLASGPNEFSRESKQFGGGHGVFTYFLLKGLMGEADRDKDNIVTARELITYLRRGVENATDGQQNIRELGDVDPTTPLAYVDKAGPADLKLGALPRPQGAEIASLLPFVPVQAGAGPEVRAAFERAVAEGRLLAPAGNNAWELYQRYIQLPIPQSQKASMQDDLSIALATTGEKLLSAYRRGDQVIRLDAAKYEEGAQLFARASQLDPEEPAHKAKAAFLQGRALVANRRYAEAIPTLREAVKLDPKSAYSYNGLGIAYLEQGQFNEAINYFQEALRRAEKWVYPRFNLAVAYSHLQRFREAEQEYRKGIELGTELGMRYAYLHLNLGVLYFQQNRLAEAEQQFRRAIEMKPDDAGSYHNLGLIFQQRNNLREAEASFQKAAELDARFAEPRLRLAEIYRQQRRRDQEERVLREAVAGDPRNVVALEALGRLLLGAKKLEDAEQTFLQMLSIDPTSAVPLSWLGDLHAEQRNFEQAADDYRQALERAADPQLRRDLQKKLSAVEKKK